MHSAKAPVVAVAAAALALAGCSAAPRAVAPPSSPPPTPAPAASVVAEPSARDVRAAAPTGMTIPQVTKFPAHVGDYAGRANQQGWDYADPDTGRSVVVVHPSGGFTYDNSVAELAGTDKALGRLGACGYRGGTGGTAMCVLRVSDGSILRLQGDAGMTYGQLVAFATDYATAAGA